MRIHPKPHIPVTWEIEETLENVSFTCLRILFVAALAINDSKCSETWNNREWTACSEYKDFSKKKINGKDIISISNFNWIQDWRTPFIRIIKKRNSKRRNLLHYSISVTWRTKIAKHCIRSNILCVFSTTIRFTEYLGS